MEEEYKIKQIKEDFVVNEVSLLPDFYNYSESLFSYLWLEKRGMTTFDALEKIGTKFGLKHEDISAQGLKDEDGVTSQLISVRKIIFKQDLENFNKKFIDNDYSVQIKHIRGYGKDQLVPRLLHGNNFNLTIRNLNKSIAGLFYDYCKNNRFISFINYYDNQRFGIVGGPYNTHIIGKEIINKNWVKAFNEFEKSKNNEKDSIEMPKNIDEGCCKVFFKKINFAKVSFFISSYNSHLWNRGANNYLKKQKIGKSEYNFNNIGYLTIPKNNNFKLPNIFTVKTKEINKKTFNTISTTQTRNFFTTTTIFPIKMEKDELNMNKYCVRISFFLPTGCYATMIIKQIFLKLKK